MNTVSIINGQALVTTIGKPANSKTFGDLADSFCSAVYSKPGGRVYIVFDRYFQESGETLKHMLGGVKRPIRRFGSRDVPLPVNWDRIMSLPDNKANFEDFLSNQRMLSRIKYSCKM